MGLSVVIALGTVWSAIALAYLSNLPIGFFVGSIGAVTYAVGRAMGGTAARQRTSPRGGVAGRRPIGLEVP